MPQEAWNQKEERQYKHILEGEEDSGRAEKTAKRIAAATVNKERARRGETKTASRTSINDMSSGQRGGQRSGQGPQGRTYAQLYEEAKREGIKGRSHMNKTQLQHAVKY